MSMSQRIYNPLVFRIRIYNPQYTYTLIYSSN